MAFAPTEAQEQAMSYRESSVLVSAGAGSGKTRVLVERLIRRVKDPESPADIDDFLIITYTRAAASELRGRIMEDLAKAIAEDPGNRPLRRQNALVSRAPIGTIHSFCSGILRENCAEVNLAPDFKVMEEDRATTMKAAALTRVLEECYSEPEKHPGFTELVDTVSTGRDDTDLFELTLALYEKMQSHARPLAWARAQVEAMRSIGEDVAQSAWGRALMEYALRRACSGHRRLQALYEELSDPCYDLPGKKKGTVEPAYASFCSSLQVTLENLDAFLHALTEEGWDAAARAAKIEFPRATMPRENKNPDLTLSEQAKTVRKSVKASTDKLPELFFAPSAELAEDMRQSAPVMEALVDLVEAFTRAYAADKRRASVVDYADLEHFAAELLTDEDGNATELARSLSTRYVEIMVDEYQDVSEVQNAIFRAISRDGQNLFFVGDVKQSIYGFRLADPTIFTAVEQRYEADHTQGKVIRMQDNFRSRREIIDCVNAVFSLCMSPDMGAVDYREGHSLRCGSTAPDAVEVPELLLVETAPPDILHPEDIPLTKDEQEAMAVAEQIRALTDPTTGRYTCGDIAILLRSVNPRAAIFADVLGRYGIPVSAGNSLDYFACLEVCAITALLTVTDNPHQDIPLTTVLLSPLFGFTPDELATVRAGDRDNDLFTALLHAGETAGGELAGKLDYFLEHLRVFRAAAPDLELSELIRFFYTELDAPAIYSAMPEGQRRYENLMVLPQLADRFLATGQADLHRFVLWLARMADGKGTVSTGAKESSAVQIMTIHKSKGLEFPVVFLCGTGHSFNEADTSERILLHKELGFGPFRLDREKRLKYQTLSRAAISRRMTEEMRSEEMRVLYVAMTRPKERLFITAADTANGLDKLEQEAIAAAGDGFIDPEQLLEKRDYLHWLMYAATADGEQHIHVSRTPAPVAPVADAEEAFAAAAEWSPAEGSEQTEAFAAQLGFRYPYAEAVTLPSKITATELKGGEGSEAEKDEEAAPAELLSHPKKTFSAFPEPDFAKKKRPLTGAALGTATHRVLQHIRLDHTGTAAAVAEEIARLQAEKYLTAEEAAAVRPEAIVQLFASSVGRRMLRADRLHREFKFSLLCTADELLHTGGDEELLLQGVMDCILEEQGEITILDYKTDYVGLPEVLAERTEYYTGQLRTYALAAERIFGKPVKECILFFLRSNLEVKVKR